MNRDRRVWLESPPACLFEVPRAIKEETAGRSVPATPIWTPGVPSEQGDHTTISIACSECLSTFAHCIRATKLHHTGYSCPHCHCRYLESSSSTSVGNALLDRRRNSLPGHCVIAPFVVRFMALFGSISSVGSNRSDLSEQCRTGCHG